MQIATAHSRPTQMVGDPGRFDTPCDCPQITQIGSIEPGKLADLVVVGRDPFREPPSKLVDIPIERTMAGGRWVYES